MFLKCVVSMPCPAAWRERDVAGLTESWRWKVDDPTIDACLNMRYAPGNWGDMLKGVWALRVTEWLCATRGEQCLAYLDLFAGPRDYPLTEDAHQRMRCAGDTVYMRRQQRHVERGRMLSTAGLVFDALQARGMRFRMDLFDGDAAKLASWRSLEEVTMLDGRDGHGCLGRALHDGRHYHLILWDPYDFFDHWGAACMDLVRAVRDSMVLVYLYNKSPRGSTYYGQYRSFRRRLDALLPDAFGRLIGRVPSDAVLPRAYHEVVLMADRGSLAALASVLQHDTRTLASCIAGPGMFEC